MNLNISALDAELDRLYENGIRCFIIRVADKTGIYLSYHMNHNNYHLKYPMARTLLIHDAYLEECKVVVSTKEQYTAWLISKNIALSQIPVFYYSHPMQYVDFGKGGQAKGKVQCNGIAKPAWPQAEEDAFKKAVSKHPTTGPVYKNYQVNVAGAKPDYGIVHV